MAAITSGRARDVRNDNAIRFDNPTCTTGTTILEGSIVMVTVATGLALPGADTAGCVCVGIACETVTVATAGQTIRVKYNHDELMDTAATFVGSTGAAAMIVNNNDVDLAAVTTNDVKVGVIRRAISTTQAWVHICGPTWI